MAVDIGADLALKVTEAFQKLYEDDITINVLTKRLEGNKAKLDDAHRYSMRVGELLAQVYRDEISSDVLPDGRMYWNIANKVIKEPLENNYKLAVEASMKAIEAQNKAKGIGLKVVRPKLAADRIEGLVNKVSDADKYDDVAFALDRPVVTFTAKACDDVVQTNADFQAEAGLRVTVVRTPRGAHTCDWCKSVAGAYDYNKVKNGHDVWRRHANCDCLIEFVSDKGREVVRNYRFSNKAKIAEREALGGINDKGAWNDISDPDRSKRDEIAEKQYSQIRNRKKSFEVEAVAKHSGISADEIGVVYDHVFINEHLFQDGSVHRFYPDYDMFLSWQRLREGRNIQKHDLTLLRHELLEAQLMEKENLVYEEAHMIAEKEYNYSKELKDYIQKEMGKG